MTFLWLLVWLFSGVPQVGRWNAWLVSLVVCVTIDVIATRRQA